MNLLVDSNYLFTGQNMPFRAGSGWDRVGVCGRTVMIGHALPGKELKWILEKLLKH